MKAGFAWASMGAAVILAGALSLSFLGAGGSGLLKRQEAAVDRKQLAAVLSSSVECDACAALDSLTKRFARAEGALARGVTRQIAKWRLTCSKEDLCRAPKMANLTALTPACASPDQEVDHLSVYGEIDGLARLVLMRGEACGDMSCPVIECKDKARMYQGLEALAAMLESQGQLAGKDPDIDDQDHAAMRRMVRAFRRSARDQISTIAIEFRKLASLINDPPSETRGLADLEEWLKWRQRHIHRLADDIDFAASETELPYDALSEGLWRIRTLAIVLGTVTDATNLIRETQQEYVGVISAPDGISREGRIAIYRAWQNLGDAMGETMLHMARITAVLNRLEKKPDWQLATSDPSANDACAQSVRRQSKDAAIKIRHAIAMFDFCGMRSGCSAKHLPNASPKPSLESAAVSDAKLREQVTALREQMLDVSIKDSPPVALSTPYETYRPGEAVTIRARGSNNMCLAAGGSWIGIYRAGLSRRPQNGQASTPLRRRDLEAIVEHETKAAKNFDVMLEAPTSPGNYTVRIFSGPILGGAQIGQMPLIVEKSQAEGCDGFSGHWSSKKSGNVWLSVRGNDVTGTYQRTRGAKPGIIVGRIRQNVLKGHWTTEFGSGGLSLRLADDGDSFSGTAGWSRDQTTGAGDWEGYCVVSDSPS